MTGLLFYRPQRPGDVGTPHCARDFGEGVADMIGMRKTQRAVHPVIGDTHLLLPITYPPNFGSFCDPGIFLPEPPKMDLTFSLDYENLKFWGII